MISTIQYRRFLASELRSHREKQYDDDRNVMIDGFILPQYDRLNQLDKLPLLQALAWGIGLNPSPGEISSFVKIVFKRPLR